MSPPSAVLILAYGSPESLDDIEAYLLDIRGGRPTSPGLVAEIKDRYARIGGASPLYRITVAQAQATAAVLRDRGFDVPVYTGMRHWQPRIHETVSKMAAAGVRQAVAIVMAPHYSALSISRYWQAISAANSELADPICFRYVDTWWDQPSLLDAQTAAVANALATVPDWKNQKLKAVFSAHSLPARYLEPGDPYQDQFIGNAQAIAARFDGLDWMLAYQSAGVDGGDWLGPLIEDVIPDLGRQDYDTVLIAPIGFVCDHVEILYDLDIEARAIAEYNGLALIRTESMNTAPMFVAAIADAVMRKLN